jgi:hypothetical protein
MYNFGTTTEPDPDLLAMVRPSTLRSIENYVQHGVCGDFLTAVADNNLREALGRADDDNRRSIREIVMVFYNYCPIDCWGSPEKRQAWQSHRGLSGLQEAA